MIKNLKIEFSIFGLLLLIIFIFANIDVGLHKIINDFSNSFNNIYFKEFFINITELGSSLWYFLISLMFFIFSFFLKKKINNKYQIFCNKLKIDSLFFIAAIFISGLLTQIIKHMVGRPRPNYSIVENNFDFFSLSSSFHSFPSGHTSTAFVSAAFMHHRYGFRVAIPAYVVATWVGYARAEDDKHFAEDVVAGAAIGFLSSRFLTTRYRGAQIAPIVRTGYYGLQVNGSF